MTEAQWGHFISLGQKSEYFVTPAMRSLVQSK